MTPVAARPSGAGGSSVPTGDLGKYQDAADKLKKRLGEIGTDRVPPGSSDAISRAYRDQAVTLAGELGQDRYPVTIAPVCGPATDILLAYQLAGASRAATASENEKARALASLSERNIENHFDQIFPLLLFAAHCAAAHVPPFEEFARGLSPNELTTVGKEAVHKLQSGFADTLGGLVIIAADPGLDMDRRTQVLRALATDGKLLARGLPLASRLSLLARLRDLPNNLDRIAQAHVDAFAAELRRKDCAKLCSL